MRGITISQPHASLFALPPTAPWRRRFVRRRTSTSYRGPVAIYAPSPTEELSSLLAAAYGLPAGKLPTAAFVAVGELADVVSLAGGPLPPRVSERWPWLSAAVKLAGPHGGPFAWIIEPARALPEPVPYAPCGDAPRARPWELPTSVFAELQAIRDPP